METRSQLFFDVPEEERSFLVLECASLYVFNLLVIADETDEGGLDHPLPESHNCLQPMISSLLEKGLIQIEPYDEGKEYVPTSKAKAYISELIEITQKYKHLTCEGLDQVKQAFYLAMDKGELKHIDESQQPWYKSITSFEFYETLLPKESQSPPQRQVSSATASEDSAIRINKKPDHFETKNYIYKKHTFIGLGVTLLFVILTQIIATSLIYFPIIISALFTIYYGAMKISLGSTGLIHKTILGSTQIDIADIDELVLSEKDGKVESFIVIGSKGDSINISPWVDDFHGLKHYLETIKDDQVTS